MFKKIETKYKIVAAGPYAMSKTYETWSYDDIDAGDTDDKGFEYKDEKFDSLWDMAKEIRDSGPVAPSHSGPATNHTWYSTVDGEEDYKTGEKTYYAFHPEGLSDTDAKQLHTLVTMPYPEFNKARPE